MSFWEKIWSIRKNFNHRIVNFSKCWLFRQISCSIIMSVFRKSFVRIRWFSSKKFLVSVFILCKCMIVFFKFSFFRWICFARKIKRLTIVWISSYDKIYQIETFNFIDKTAFVSVIIRRDVISMNLFIIVRSAHNIEWKWRIHFFRLRKWVLKNHFLSRYVFVLLFHWSANERLILSIVWFDIFKWKFLSTSCFLSRRRSSNVRNIYVDK